MYPRQAICRVDPASGVAAFEDGWQTLAESEIASLPVSRDPHHGPAASGRREPLAIEIACIHSVHERGFAFARLLTGAGASAAARTSGAGEIFLNEARVAALKGEVTSLVGAVVAVQPVVKPDGRLSALQGWPIALHDSYTASRLWERVTQHRNVSPEALAPAHDVLPETPALLPLALVLLDARCSEALAQTLVSRLPEDAWIATAMDLHLPLEHAGPGVRKKVLLHLVEHDPLRAYYLLLSSRLRAGITLTDPQIENLWLAGEARELDVGGLLAAWSREVALYFFVVSDRVDVPP